MIQDSNILVVDDNADHGRLICNQLRDSFIPYRFFHYSMENMESLVENPAALVGVRVVFQDLNLIQGTAIPTKADYSAASAVLNRLLINDNGPWLLITWSTYTGAGGEENEYALQLFEYLNESLDIGKRPFDFLVLNKTEFSIPGDSGEASIEDIPTQSKIDLSEKITSLLNERKALHLLYDWERSTKIAAAHSVSELANIASEVGPSSQDETLGNLIYSLAAAEAGKHHEQTPLTRGLHNALNKILKDKADIVLEEIDAKEVSRTDSGIDVSAWKAKLNKALHLENSNSHKLHRPGSVYELTLNELPNILPDGFDCGTEKKVLSLIRGQFLEFPNNATTSLKREVSRQCTLVAIDVTADCDYANKKAFWNRFMIGIIVPENLVVDGYLWRINRDAERAGETDIRVFRSLKGDNLDLGPVMNIKFKNLGECRLVFNSELTFPIRANAAHSTLDYEIGTIRESLLNNLRSWMGRHSSRSGIVELR